MTTFSKTDRPKIKVPLRPLDYILEIAAVLGLLLLNGLAFAHYDQLPDQIPAHFRTDGRTDQYRSKITLWVLPMVGLGMFLFMTITNRRPEKFNYLVEITPENAGTQYQLVTRVIRILKAFVMILFAFLIWRFIRLVQGRAELQNTWLLPAVMIITLCITFYYILKSTAQK